MRESSGKAGALTPQESWNAIHATMDRARSSMYVAGTSTILVLWGAIASLGIMSQYAIETFAADFMSRNPWTIAPLWGVLMVLGMAGSAIIGHRAGRKDAAGDAIRTAGIRMFFFWLAVVAAAFFVPAAAGMWNAEAGDSIPRVTIGIVALGHILFGIMHRPMIAAVGVGIAAAFYIPSYLAGDAAPMVTAVAFLVVAALSAAWIRKSGVL